MTNHQNRSKQPTFREGQEVEVRNSKSDWATWRKAKIVENQGKPDVNLDIWNVNIDNYMVQFQDGTRAVFDAEHIKTIPNRDLEKMTSEELQESLNDSHQ